MAQTKPYKRKIICRYLRSDGNRCTGEALNEHSDILLCYTHTTRAVRSMDLTPDLLDKLVPARSPSAVRAGVGRAEPDRIAGIEVVYYIRRSGLIKIGTTSNLRQRMKTLEPDELLATEPGGRDVEKRRHTQFQRLLERGQEWFMPAPELMEHIAQVIREHGDPDPAEVAWIADRGRGRRRRTREVTTLSEDAIQSLPREVQDTVRRLL